MNLPTFGKSIRRMVLTVTMVPAVLSLLLSGSHAAQQPARLTYAAFCAPGTLPFIQMERWKDLAESRTNGMVLINTATDGALSDAGAVFEAVTAGEIDIGCLPVRRHDDRFQALQAVALPLGIADARTGSRVLLDLIRRQYTNELSRVKVLAAFTSSPLHLLSVRPIQKLDDIKGLDFRATGGTAHILAAWDVNPVGMPAAALPQAFEQGVIKGLLTTLDAFKTADYAPYLQYATLTASRVQPFIVIMNLDKWNALAAPSRDILAALTSEHSQWCGATADERTRQAAHWAVSARQVTIIDLTDRQREQWNQRLYSVTARWVEQANAKRIPANAILSQIRASIGRREKVQD